MKQQQCRPSFLKSFLLAEVPWQAEHNAHESRQKQTQVWLDTLPPGSPCQIMRSQAQSLGTTNHTVYISHLQHSLRHSIVATWDMRDGIFNGEEKYALANSQSRSSCAVSRYTTATAWCSSYLTLNHSRTTKIQVGKRERGRDARISNIAQCHRVCVAYARHDCRFSTSRVVLKTCFQRPVLLGTCEQFFIICRAP